MSLNQSNKMEISTVPVLSNEFDGVFRFTNPTEEDFCPMWNNKEYKFLSNTTSPMIIANETLENIQNIRKKWAYKLAVREFYKTKEYVKMSKMGGGLPPTFDEKILQPWIDQCLKPLPAGRAVVTEMPKDDGSAYKVSKALGEKDSPNFIFRDDTDKAPSLGVMPNNPVVQP